MAKYPLTQSGAEVQALLNKVQTPDTTPTIGSTNLVTSGGTKDALDQKAAKSDVDAIKEKIPSSASSSNKMTTQADIADFITRAVTDLVNYYTKSQTYTKTEVNNLIGALHQFHFEIYATLPASGDGSVLYLIGPTGTGSDKYEEYVWANNTFVKIGDTTLDLSGYVTTEALNTALADYTTTEALAELLANKANIDGYYETLAVGIAKNLEGRNDVTDSFMERTTGGDAEVANGAAQLTEVAGKSQVWNQLVQNGNFVGISSWGTAGSGSSLSAQDNIGTLTLGSNSNSTRIQQSISFINGHKYLVSADIKAIKSTKGKIGVSSSAGFFFPNISILTTWTNYSVVKQVTNDSNLLYLYVNTEQALVANDTVDFRNIFVLDLTLLGIDNLTTVEEVEAWLAENIGLKPYYPYNAGTVLNSKMQGIESLGFNLLDPTTGKARIVGAYSDVYGNYYGITGTHGTLTFTSDLGETSEITPDSDGKFLLEEPGWLDIATPGADCAVFLWWDGTQTEYTEFEQNIANFDVTHIYGKLNGEGELVQVFPDGMAGIGTAKDALRIEDGVTVARKRVGKVDMGTLNWVYNETYLYFRCDIDSKRAVSGVGVSNLLCHKYLSINRASYTSIAANDNVIAEVATSSPGKNVVAVDSSYTNAATFKTANSGVMLYYELATEQLYTDLVYQGSSLFADGTPVELPVNYRVNNWGIERMIPQNDSDVVTTFPELTCRYSIDAVEQLNTHTDEIEDLYEGLDELDEKKPNKSGSYPGMAVGSAKAIEGNDTKVEDFTFTPIQCADGLAQIKDVRGKSLVWNQLVQNGNFASDSKWSIVNGTGSISDGVATLTASETNKNQIQQTTGNYFINGHRYYASAIINSGDANVKRLNAGGVALAQTSGTGKQEIAEIISWSVNSGSYKVGVRDLATENFQQYTVEKIVVIDLTLMFGAGKEPATVEEFEKMFPLPYYAYNAGALISNKTEQIESVGFNQWDEEIDLGYFDENGGWHAAPSGTQIASKNYIPVLGGADYYFKKGVRHIPYRVVWYDGNKQVISVVTGVQNAQIQTAPNNAVYCKFSSNAPSSAEYLHDICINLSDPSRNGTYEPYKKDTVELNLPTLTGKLNGEGESVVVFPDGLKSAGSVYDEIVGNRAIKRIGVADLGTLDWNYIAVSSDRPYGWLRAPGPTDKAVGQLNVLCGKYITKADINTDKVVYGQSSGQNINMVDSAYTDAATFKTAMSGVMLYYELATPEEYILDTPIPATFQAYKGGTLKQLPENTSTPTTAPMVMENVYAIDVLSVIQSLPQNYVSKESLQAMLASMQSAGLFSAYTMTWDETNQRYTFTFTANPTE